MRFPSAADLLGRGGGKVKNDRGCGAFAQLSYFLQANGGQAASQPI
jgi:hypothetical protein